jgi:signal transduction histidine kinase/ActR/RegA family two-component response regulator
MNRNFARIWGMPKNLLAEGDDKRILGFMHGVVVDQAAYQQGLADAELKPDGTLSDIIELVEGRFLERHLVPLYINNQFKGQVFSFRDITPQKRHEEELRRAKLEADAANRAKSAFLATMSHEIRTPMNAILGMAEILSETSLTLEQQKYVEVFQHAGKNLLELINDILDMSKVEAEQLELDKSAFSLKKMLLELLDLHTIRAVEKGLKLTLEIEPAVAEYVNGDVSRLRQCLTNLIGNAIKFTRSGIIAVRVHRMDGKPDMLQFSVSDSGIGIPLEKQESIFEAFSQVDSTITRRFGGTGLGLTITRRLIALMNGEIWVQSKEHEGATFFFTAQLIALTQHQELDGQVPLRTEASAALQGLRILLAEDNKDNALLIEVYLKRTLHRLDLASDGLVALEKFRLNRYDVILMDIQMPNMGGYEATAAIRSIEAAESRAPVTIIALTANAFKDDELRCIAAGCNFYLTKPVKKKTLLEMLQTIAPVALP